jgi:transposase
MEVDFGYLGITYDPLSRRNRKTWLFSARLRHSRLAWREAVFHQSGPVFFLAHMHAFEYFGGVPWAAIPNNLKAAVLRASWNEPLLNRSYRPMLDSVAQYLVVRSTSRLLLFPEKSGSLGAI